MRTQTSHDLRSVLGRCISSRLGHLVVAVVIGAVCCPVALAGSGQINNTGTIDITVNFRFPPTTGDITNFRSQVTGASRVIWDASEGQLRFGNVTMTCGSVNEDLADFWIYQQPGRSGTSFYCDGSGLGRLGMHIAQFLPSSTGG